MSATPLINAGLDGKPSGEELGWLQFTTLLYYLHETKRAAAAKRVRDVC